MGQGGYVTLVNATPYEWFRTYQDQYQMNAWDFPSTIPAGETASTYVEGGSGSFQPGTHENGVVIYTLGSTGLNFRLEARAVTAFQVEVLLPTFGTSGNPQGSTIELGWIHDGYVNFILGGTVGSFTSTRPPRAWMHENLGLLGGRTLRHLCIPGSHDAGMSTLGSKTAFAQPCNTLTQTLGILDQLKAGARYFDVRPVISDGEYVTGHYSYVSQIGSWQGGNGQSMASIVQDVNEFTAANAELVVLYLSHDLNTDVGNASYRPFTHAEWEALLTELEKLEHRFKGQPSVGDLTRLTLNDYIGGDTAAVVVVVDPSDDSIGVSNIQEGFWGDAWFPVYDDYTGTNDPAAMSADQLSKMRVQRTGPDASYFLLSWTLTQDGTQASTCVLGTAASILDLANEANPALFRDLLPACSARTYPNILYIDAVHGSDAAALALAVTQRAMQP